MKKNLSSKVGLSLCLLLSLGNASVLAQDLASLKQIKISKEVPYEQELLIKKDINTLKSMIFAEAPEDMTKSVMGLSVINANTLNKWLNERVSLVIGERFDLDNRLEISREKVIYPNQFVKPDYKLDQLSVINQEETNGLDPILDFESYVQERATLAALNEEKDDGGVITVMSNIGAALYTLGKDNKVLAGINTALNIREKDVLQALSPRVGIIQIGKGLFHKNLTVSPETPNNLANTINRLGTFFHEARHSDGNGKSLVFGHARCPKEVKEYAGFAACDRNKNGPYSVGVVTILEMTKNCKERCSKKETQILAMIALDSASRIVKERSGAEATLWDASPELAKLQK